MACDSYYPDIQAMGDCMTCGHTYEAHLHRPVQTREDRLFAWPGDDAPIDVLCLPVSALYGQRREDPVEEAAPVDNSIRRKRTRAEIEAADRAITRLCKEGWDVAEMVDELGMHSSTIGERIKMMGLRDEWLAAKQFRRVRPKGNKPGG